MPVTAKNCDDGVAIPAGASWTTIFQSTEAGGSNGPGALLAELKVDDDASYPAEFRVKPMHDSGEQKKAAIGALQTYAAKTHEELGAGPITLIQARGDGGATKVSWNILSK